jgi:4'-phosphopantetheinyl transferase EntD
MREARGMPEDQSSQLRFNIDLPIPANWGVRRIEAGDEQCLSAAESAGRERAVLSVRRASGAARLLARQLCAQLGVSVAEIPRSGTGLPAWPEGIAGSLAHDSDYAAAIIARREFVGGVGIDIEPIETLSAELIARIATPPEQRQLSAGGLSAKGLFCIKEAVYKAANPHDRIFLDFREVLVDLAAGSAITAYGRRLHWRLAQAPRVLAIAWW